MKRMMALMGLGILTIVLATIARSVFDNNNATRLQRAQALVVAEAPEGALHWNSSMKAALEEAKKSNKPVMIDFFAPWCGPCHILDAAYRQPVLVKELSKWITVKINKDKNQDIADTYGVTGLPTILFLSPSGDEIGRKEGIAIPPAKSAKESLGLVALDVFDTLKEQAEKAKQKKTPEAGKPESSESETAGPEATKPEATEPETGSLERVSLK